MQLNRCGSRMHCSARRGDIRATRQAAEVIRWHMEAGWDEEYGGLFLGIDAEGQTPFLPNATKKIWWPHTEALYALLLAYKLTGESWCWEWYKRVHEWSFTHFPMAPGAEWFQRLDRYGKPIKDTIALPVKDPFHLPRAVLLILKLLSEWTSDATETPARL
jgi:N-acylglucosamine 2-epimerase